MTVADVALFHTGDSVFFDLARAWHTDLGQSASLIESEAPFTFVVLTGVSGTVNEIVDTRTQGDPPQPASFRNPSLSAVGATGAHLSRIYDIIKKHILYDSPCPAATASSIAVQLSLDRSSATYTVDVAPEPPSSPPSPPPTPPSPSPPPPLNVSALSLHADVHCG